MIKRILPILSVLLGFGYSAHLQAQCTGPMTVTITGSTTGQPLTLGSASVTSPIPCFGGTATVTLVVTGGNPPYSYTFNSVTNTTGVFTGVVAGTSYAYSITDDKSCGPITGNLDVPQPEEVTKSASAQQAIICSGANAKIDVTTTMMTLNKAFNWTATYGAVTGGAGSATSVAFGTGAINEALINGTNADIVVTYTITPYSFGLDGIDDGGMGDDCIGMPMDVTVTVEPTPTKSASAQNAIICSGSNAAINVTTTLTTTKTRFKWSATYGAVTGGVGSAASVAFGTGAISETLTNGTNADIVVTYTITPYTFGPNGVDNNGTGDDCLGTPFTVDVKVEPTPAATPSAAMETICGGSAATITVDVTAINGNKYIVQSISNPGNVGGVTAAPYTRADGATIDAGLLTNATSTTQTVTYTIVPYTYGPNGVDNNGTGDDCLGTPFTVDVKVEPTPAATPSAAMETICGGTPTITVDVTAINGNKYLVQSISNPGNVGGVTAAPYTRADGATIDPGSLSNPTNATQTVTYTIVPYTYGPNGVDNNGTGDDCLGAPFTVAVKVEPATPAATPSAAMETICSGTAATITVDVTAIDGNNYRVQSISNLGGVTGVSTAPYTRADGATVDANMLTNSSNATQTVTYTIVPYNYGPNGIDDNGTGDDCLGTPFTVDVKVEPTPTKTATAQLSLICSGTKALIDVSTTLTTPSRFKWSASYGAVTGGASSATSVAFGVGAINDGSLVNATSSSIVVTYTITPYTFGPNGVDDGGTGDDCLGMPMDVPVTVNPRIIAATCTPTDDLCQLSAGEVKVEASGGTGVLNITWTATPNAPFAGPATGTPAGTAQAVPNTPGVGGYIIYSGLSGNTTYNFVVTDANGCQVL